MAVSNKDKKKEKRKTQKEINYDNLVAGLNIINRHPLFGDCDYFYHRIADKRTMGTNTMCIVSPSGEITANQDICLNPSQWAYAIAHSMLHLAFGHFDADKMPGYVINENGKNIKKADCNPLLWNMACDIYVNKFLADIKFGQSIHSDASSVCPGDLNDEVKIYETLQGTGITGNNNAFGTSAIGTCDMKGLDKPLTYDEEQGQHNRHIASFTYALAHSVSRAVIEAGGHTHQSEKYLSNRKKAAMWFIDHYPLLGGIASHFKIIEDYSFCNKNDIHIAAIDVTCGELYLNPAASLSLEEWKFVLAHEYLHAGLMHHNRCNGRDHYLWNVACDFVINGWLHELQVGVMPEDGLLYDPDLKGMSAESIYDMLLTDMKKYAKFNTFRGFHKGDIIAESVGKICDGVTLDDFCRSAMQQGLEYHHSIGHGLVPAGHSAPQILSNGHCRRQQNLRRNCRHLRFHGG